MYRSQRLAEKLSDDVQSDGDCWHSWTETRTMRILVPPLTSMLILSIACNCLLTFMKLAFMNADIPRST